MSEKVFDYLLEEGGEKLDLFSTESAVAESTAPAPVSPNLEFNTDSIHTALQAAGLTPGYGFFADMTDSALFAFEGEFGNAALSAAAAIPFIGQFVTTKRALKAAKEAGEEMVTLWRGVGGWHKGKMVNKQGNFISPKNAYGDPIASYGKNPGEGLWLSTDKKIAEDYMQTYEKGSKLLEFEMPKSYFDKFSEEIIIGGAPTNYKRIIFQEGIPKEFLKKVHR